MGVGWGLRTCERVCLCTCWRGGWGGVRVCMIAKFSVSESMRVSMTMSFRDHRASSRHLDSVSVLVLYARACDPACT